MQWFMYRQSTLPNMINKMLFELALTLRTKKTGRFRISADMLKIWYISP